MIEYWRHNHDDQHRRLSTQPAKATATAKRFKRCRQVACVGRFDYFHSWPMGESSQSSLLIAALPPDGHELCSASRIFFSHSILRQD
jgi:hypothetical protein